MKDFLNIIYYNSTIIENRNNLDCKKTLSFVKENIFYNILTDIDVNYFVTNCNDLSRNHSA